MSQVSQEIRFTSQRSVNQCLDAAQRSLGRLGGFAELNGKSVAVKLGSQVRTRLLGGMFVSNDKLPMRVTVTVQDGRDERRVFIVAEDRLGLGTTLGLTSRYQMWCKQLVERVSDDMQYALNERRGGDG